MRTLESHRQNKYHSRRKTANALLRSLSVNIYRTLSLNTVLSPVEKRFLQETFTLCECCFCSLNVLRAVAIKKKQKTKQNKTYD